METKKSEIEVSNRRNFLKLSAVSAAAAGTLAVAGGASASQTIDVTGSGYRETAHVKAFYETARF